MPDFQASFTNETLSVQPSFFSISIYLDEFAEIIIEDQESEATQFLIIVDTDKSIAEAITGEEIGPGFYVYKDGLYSTNGLQSFVSKYSELNYNLPEKQFDKEQLRLLIKAFTPQAVAWLWKWGVIGGAILTFCYVFFGAWLLAVLFSIFGSLALLIMKKPLDYGFLIKLSFYCMVPVIVFWLLSAMLAILIPWLLLFVYSTYYYYGIKLYQNQ